MVTSSRSPKSITQVAENVTIVTAEEIERYITIPIEVQMADGRHLLYRVESNRLYPASTSSWWDAAFSADAGMSRGRRNRVSKTNGSSSGGLA